MKGISYYNKSHPLSTRQRNDHSHRRETLIYLSKRQTEMTTIENIGEQQINTASLCYVFLIITSASTLFVFLFY